MKTKLTRLYKRASQKSPHKWLTDYLGQSHSREPKPKKREWVDIDDTKSLQPAPDARGWVVLMVEPRMEIKAATALREAGYVAWFPQTVETITNTKRMTRRRVNRTLFPRYVFAASFGRIGMGDCDHVSAIIGAVPAALVADLSARQAEGEFEVREVISQFGKNTRVRISDGPFGGLEGIVHRSEGRRVEVLLSFLGAERAIPLDVSQVEVA